MKKVYILLVFALLCIGTVFGQTEKKVNNSFNVGNSGSLTIKNSFGDIHIEPFNGDKIEVEVTITVETRNEKDVQKYLDKIMIDVSESGNNVTLRTINEMNGGNKVKEFSIDYDVKVPRKTALNIRNTFGDLTILSSEGQLDINVQHGDAFVGPVNTDKSKRHELRMQFGDLRVESISNTDIRMQHGDFTIEKFNGGDIELSFGDGNIETLSGDIILDFQHSELKVDKVENLDGLDANFQFSDFRASGFTESDYELDMEGSFTDFNIRGNFDVERRDEGMNSNSLLLYSGDRSRAKKIRIRGSHSDISID